MIRKILLLLSFVFIFGNSYAQLPRFVSAQKYSAVGAGASGIPTVTFDVPAGKNRIMAINILIERYHNPLSTNHPVPPSTFGTYTLKANVGGNSYDLTSVSMAKGPGSASIDERSYTLTQFFGTINLEMPAVPAGSTTITFPNINSPNAASDEISVIVSVFENVKSVKNITNGFPRALTNSATDLGTTSGALASSFIPNGRTLADVLLVAHAGISQASLLSMSPGWSYTPETRNVVSNTVSFPTGSGITTATNTPIGISSITSYGNVSSGNPSFNVFRANTGPLEAGASYLLALLPFASPSITGNVYQDVDNGTNINGTGTNAGGTYVNVIDTDNKVVYAAAVDATGAFSVPNGVVTEGLTYRLELSKNGGTIGATPPAKELPTGWVTIGESKTGVSPYANDGTADGTISLTVYTNDITNLRYGINNCVSGTAAPNLINTAQYSSTTKVYTIPCGSLTANLSVLTASNTPGGATITWHTSAVATDANKVAANAISGTSKLYAAFYNTTGLCYSQTIEVIIAAPICAVNDNYEATPIIAGVGGRLPSIFNNDTYNGVNIATMPPYSVEFIYELWQPSMATVDLATDGSLIIPASTPPGTYTFYYKICDKDPDILASSSCAIAEVVFKVVSRPIISNPMMPSKAKKSN